MPSDKYSFSSLPFSQAIDKAINDSILTVYGDFSWNRF